MNVELSKKDYTLVIDKSGSMDYKDMPGNQSRWKAARESTYAIASKVSKLDPDGLDLWLFSNECKSYRQVSPEKVLQIFQENEPYGGTNMSEVLKQVLKNYFKHRDEQRLKKNGEMVLVITDGQPDNKQEVADILVKSANKLKPEDQLSINFIQVGYDPEATQFLDFLDHELTEKMGARRDFVSTVKINDIERVGLQQFLLNTVAGTA